MSLTLSDVEQAADNRLASPDHLVSRKAVLERIGMAVENGLPPSHNRSQASSRYGFLCTAEIPLFIHTDL